MNPIDFRNETFASLHARLVQKRESVWLDWLAYEVRHGSDGATTRAVCVWNQRDILQFRPRCTELFQIGVLKLAAESCGREGRYLLRSMEEWESWHGDQVQAAVSAQQQLL